MKKIYFRGGMTPFNIINTPQMLSSGYFGGNIGNLLYQYGVIRSLQTSENDIFIPNEYRHKSMLEVAEEINQTCDYFIIPLADAFRDNFQTELNSLTEMVKRLTIPCVVIGVGLRAHKDVNVHETAYPFDDTVKKFVSAILDKSASIGVRGQITSDYLTRLGFIEGKHHMPIGCPSMYTLGNHLDIRTTQINEKSKFTLNLSTNAPDNIREFVMNNAKRFDNSYFVPQEFKELRMMYLKAPYNKAQTENYPGSVDHFLYEQNRIRFPLSARSWFDFMKDTDLSFGSRLHGNIAATLGGAPSILFVKDARTRELSEYHGLVNFDASQINPNDNILDIVEKCDFKKPLKYQKENLSRYVDFLNQNGLDHIYKESQDIEISPFDRAVEKIKIQPMAETAANIDDTRLLARFDNYYKAGLKIRKEQRNNLLKKFEVELEGKSDALITDYQKQINALKKENERYKNILDCRPVKTTIKIRNAFHKDKNKIKI